MRLVCMNLVKRIESKNPPNPTATPPPGISLRELKVGGEKYERRREGPMNLVKRIESDKCIRDFLEFLEESR